jgi:serine/threonine protein kinase
MNKTMNQVEELKLNLKLLREYNANEKKLIEAQIVEFKREFAEGKSSSTNSDLNKVLINAKELESEEVIGKGAFGEVYRGKYHGQAVAVKTLISVDHDSLTRFREEILLMADLHHANIVVLIGACWEESLMALVMEFCEKGMSSSVLKKEGSSFSWEDPLLKWSLDVARAMQYLHSVIYYNVKTKEEVHGIMHR